MTTTLTLSALPSDPLVVVNGPLSEALAQRLGLRTVADFTEQPGQQYVFYRDGTLYLGLAPSQREHPVCVDFAEQHRRRHRGKELLLKAVGGRRTGLRIVDTTAGLGRDSLLLASYGAEVTLCEREPVVAEMLADGLRRGLQQAEVAEFVARMRLVPGPASAYLRAIPEADRPDVIYLDPMFPDSGKSAQVKKEMRLFHSLVGRDEDDGVLLQEALDCAKHRVVVKRAPRSAALSGPRPQFAVQGKAVRFDVYPLKAFPKG